MLYAFIFIPYFKGWKLFSSPPSLFIDSSAPSQNRYVLLLTYRINSQASKRHFSVLAYVWLAIIEFSLRENLILNIVTYAKIEL